MDRDWPGIPCRKIPAVAKTQTCTVRIHCAWTTGLSQVFPRHRPTSRPNRIEFLEVAPFTGLRIDPDAPPAVLHVLLDHALLPAAGNVAEVGIKQVVRAHDGKAGVVSALLRVLPGATQVLEPQKKPSKTLELRVARLPRRQNATLQLL